MSPEAEAAVAAWVTEAGLAGTDETALLHGFCARLSAAGVPLSRAVVIVDTLHPVHEGRAFRWRREPSDEPAVTEYGRTTEDGAAAQSWRRSPFYHLLATGEPQRRRRLAAGDPADFPILADLRGQDRRTTWPSSTASPRMPSSAMDCVYSSWVSAGPDRFTDAQGGALVRLPGPHRRDPGRDLSRP